MYMYVTRIQKTARGDPHNENLFDSIKQSIQLVHHRIETFALHCGCSLLSQAHLPYPSSNARSNPLIHTIIIIITTTATIICCCYDDCCCCCDGCGSDVDGGCCGCSLWPEDCRLFHIISLTGSKSVAKSMSISSSCMAPKVSIKLQFMLASTSDMGLGSVLLLSAAPSKLLSLLAVGAAAARNDAGCGGCDDGAPVRLTFSATKPAAAKELA